MKALGYSDTLLQIYNGYTVAEFVWEVAYCSPN